MLLTLMISTITLVLVRSHRYLCKHWQKGDYMETVMMMRLCLGVVVCLAQPLGNNSIRSREASARVTEERRLVVGARFLEPRTAGPSIN